MKKDTQKENKAPFPIIGIGASAGGFEAFEQFFHNVPENNGMAFILVPHLDPGHASMLTKILQISCHTVQQKLWSKVGL